MSARSPAAPAAPSTPQFKPEPAGGDVQHLLRVLSCDHRELRDGSGTINKTNAMKIFTLADKDLKGVPFEPVKLNPKWRPAQFYTVEAVAAACLKKHGSLQGLRAAQAKNKAKAAKAAATKRGESKDPVVKALLTALGLTGVQTINKKWAKGLFCLTDKDIKDILFSEAPGHYEGYRSQHMYKVKDLVPLCLAKHGSLEGLKAAKAKKSPKTVEHFYTPHEPKTYESSGVCCPWPNCMCEAFEAQEDYDP